MLVPFSFGTLSASRETMWMRPFLYKLPLADGAFVSFSSCTCRFLFSFRLSLFFFLSSAVFAGRSAVFKS